VIFVDNSGADIILGILPFAREMLRLGMQVLPQFFFFMHNYGHFVLWFGFLIVRSCLLCIFLSCSSLHLPF